MNILLAYIKRYKKLALLSLLFATINQCFSLLDPMIYGKIIDKYAKNPDEYTSDEFIKGTLLLISAAIGVAMISRIAKAFQDYTMNLLIQKSGADIYTEGLKHTLLIPYEKFEDQRSGETLNILQKVRSDAEKFINQFINVLFTSVIGIVFVIMYAINVYSGLIIVYVIACIVLGLVMNVLSKKIKKVQQRILSETKLLAGSTTESLRNIELVKSLGLINQETHRLNLATKRILQLELKKVRDIRSIAFIQGTLVNLLRQTILFMLLYLCFNKVLSVGEIITLQFYSFFIFGPLQELGNVLISFRETEASMENLMKILNTPIEERPLQPVPLGHIKSLAFENVTFKHLSSQFPAISDVSFTINHGETIAFVGPSGSGKSTLVKLLVGLYKPVEGTINYNGINALKTDKTELQQQLGFVTQDTQLFAGSIKDNLLFVKPNANDSELTTALQQARCMNIIERSGNGLDTIIGEGGLKLSGGEKQRLSIARAILRKPNLLIFDEATSALDSLTEEAITETIKEISSTQQVITVLIAHRLSTIMHADRIYVLEKGKIIETGKHENLIAEKGLYYAMWRQQIGERR